MTDPKGDRSLPPQPRRTPTSTSASSRSADDGIVVRGAKAHQTGAVNSHEIIVMPTIAMREADEDLRRRLRAPQPTPRASPTSSAASPATPGRSRETDLDAATISFGGHEALVVFDDVFVPWERVFLCGEYDFTGALVEQFASYHRQSYACKVGVGDVLIGAPQVAAEYNGVAKASHIRDKIIEMNHLNETLLLRLHRLRRGGASGGGRHLHGGHASRQRPQAERHPLPLRDRPARPGHRRRAHRSPSRPRRTCAPKIGPLGGEILAGEATSPRMTGCGSSG